MNPIVDTKDIDNYISYLKESLGNFERVQTYIGELPGDLRVEAEADLLKKVYDALNIINSLEIPAIIPLDERKFVSSNNKYLHKILNIYNTSQRRKATSGKAAEIHALRDIFNSLGYNTRVYTIADSCYHTQTLRMVIKSTRK